MRLLSLNDQLTGVDSESARFEKDVGAVARAIGKKPDETTFQDRNHDMDLVGADIASPEGRRYCRCRR